MKAEVAQQRWLLELAKLDAELARIAHRSTHLAEQHEYERAAADHRTAGDRRSAVGIALDDLDGEVSYLESEIDAVRQREDRDAALLESGASNPKQVADVQHELETLHRRRSALEDSLLELMERREELTAQDTAESATLDELQSSLTQAQRALDGALADLEETRTQRASRRDELVAALDSELMAIYERQRAAGGAGAGQLQGGRCGACRIEIDRGEQARIAAAAEDDVLRCPECSAILLRVSGAEQ